MVENLSWTVKYLINLLYWGNKTIPEHFFTVFGKRVLSLLFYFINSFIEIKNYFMMDKLIVIIILVNVHCTVVAFTYYDFLFSFIYCVCVCSVMGINCTIFVFCQIRLKLYILYCLIDFFGCLMSIFGCLHFSDLVYVSLTPQTLFWLFIIFVTSSIVILQLTFSILLAS